MYDSIRKKWIVLTAEEHVRQYFIYHLVHEKKYPPALIAVEKKIQIGDRFKRFDIVVFDQEHKPWMLIECKEPAIELSQQALFQLLHYQRALQSRYWVITNGHQTYCANASDINNVAWLSELPTYL